VESATTELTRLPGLEVAGTVVACGDAVRAWKEGDRVFGLVGGGGLADRVVVHERHVAAVPERLSEEEAASAPEIFITAHDALWKQAALAANETVLIHAAGSGVCTAAIQLAHNTGATTYGTSRTPAKLEKARSLGLDVGISNKNFASEVNQLTGGAGVHVVLDFIGAPYLEQNLEALTSWGRIVFLSTMGGTQANINLGMLMSKRISMRGVTLRTRTLEEKMAATRRFATSVLPLLANGKVKPIIEHVYSLEEIGAAHAVMAENKNFGKLVVRVD